MSVVPVATPRRFSVLALAALLSLSAATRVLAQTPTGTISGRVVDSSGLAVVGALVSAQSPNLQGARTATTTENGDYLLPLLPPGSYTVTITLTGFAAVKQDATVAATETVMLNATLKPATVTEEVSVTASREAFVNTVQSATSITQQLVQSLPTARTLLSAINLAPAVHNTGPSGNFSIGGAMSFENLYMINGVQIQDNLRGTPFNLFIEDAIQETTITTSGISAEYGRFAGGVVNAITKSGGNVFGGSFRTSVTNDDWRTVSPFGEPKTDKTVPSYEYTIGGPIWRDRTWFFGAGRNRTLTTSAQTGFTTIPYVEEDTENRAELKITQAITANHRVQGNFTAVRQEQVNDSFPSPSGIMDTRSLYTRQLPQNLISVHYTGVLRPNLFAEVQVSRRDFTFENSGGTSTDLILGTVLQDQQTGARWWAPTFCGVCGPEERDNENLLLKGKYFLSHGTGSHELTFGYDLFNDKRRGNNHQAGSDFHVWSTTSRIAGDTVVPVITDDFNTWIIHWPIRDASLGTNFRTHSLFLNDRWAPTGRLTLNLGVRWDRNHGEDAIGKLVANDSAFSPRLGAAWDPFGTGRWSVHGSYARYVTALANTIADASSPAGTPAIFAYFYEGPEINIDPNGPQRSTDQALQTVFDWFFANGGLSREPFFVDIPGVATQIRGSLASPHADEIAVGLSRTLGSRGAIRADAVVRDYGDFYIERVDTSTGQVTDEFGQSFDLKLVENGNVLKRRYKGLSVQSTYRLNSRTQLGANYTVSSLRGNVDGETIGSGPVASSILSYPEYFDVAWSNPEGRLLADQRHRARVWAHFDVPISARIGRLGIGLLHQAESGTPYSAIGAVRTGNFVANPGYETPPDTVDYFFSERGAFRTEPMYRTDLSFNYARTLPGANRAELFAQFHLLNVFNQFQMFNISGDDINTTVLTAFDDPARFQTFNPFSETPVQGVHWDFGPDFGKPLGATAFTLPRTFRFSFGVRF